MWSDEDTEHQWGQDAEPAEVPDTLVEYEDWMDYHASEVAAIFRAARDKAAELGVYVLDACDPSDFAQFCFDMSSGRKPPV